MDLFFLYSLKDDPIEHLLYEFKVPYLIVGKSLNYENIIHIDNDNIDATSITQYLYHLDTDIYYFTRIWTLCSYEDRSVGFKTIRDDVKISNDCVISPNDLRDFIKQYCIDASHMPSVIITSDVMLNMQY